jgi:hypothetical protein
MQGSLRLLCNRGWNRYEYICILLRHTSRNPITRTFHQKLCFERCTMLWNIQSSLMGLSLFFDPSPVSNDHGYGTRGSAVSWGTMLQSGLRGFDCRWGHSIFHLPNPSFLPSLRVFENRVLRRIFGPKRDEVSILFSVEHDVIGGGCVIRIVVSKYKMYLQTGKTSFCTVFRHFTERSRHVVNHNLRVIKQVRAQPAAKACTFFRLLCTLYKCYFV